MINEDDEASMAFSVHGKPLTFSPLLPLQRCLSIRALSVQLLKWSQQDSNL